MTNPAPCRRPSNELGELHGQLLHELQRLEEAGPTAEEPDLFRAYLQHIQALAWERVARGDLGAPREILDHLLTAQPYVDAHRPVLRPAERASIEVERVIRSFCLADEVLEAVRVERRLSERRSETEREVLRVLLKNRTEYLCRSDVGRRMKSKRGISAGRVGQILVELLHEGLLQRVHGRTQGSPNASFYALSPRGLDVCQRLGMVVQPDDRGSARGKEELVSDSTVLGLRVHEIEIPPGIAIALKENDSVSADYHGAISCLLDPRVPPQWREILAGLLANVRYEEATTSVPPALLMWLETSKLDEEAERLLRTTRDGWSYRLRTLHEEDRGVTAEAEFLRELIQTAGKALARLSAVQVNHLAEVPLWPDSDMAQARVVKQGREDRPSSGADRGDTEDLRETVGS